MAERQTLSELLLLERRLVVAYDASLDTGLLGHSARATVRRLRSSEADHVSILSDLLEDAGGTPPPAPDDRVPGLAGVADERGVLDFVRDLEEVSVAAYYDALQKLTQPQILRSLALIMAVEGQHLALVRRDLGQPPVPHAFETGEP